MLGLKHFPGSWKQLFPNTARDTKESKQISWCNSRNGCKFFSQGLRDQYKTELHGIATSIPFQVLYMVVRIGDFSDCRETRPMQGKRRFSKQPYHMKIVLMYWSLTSNTFRDLFEVTYFLSRRFYSLKCIFSYLMAIVFIHWQFLYGLVVPFFRFSSQACS